MRFTFLPLLILLLTSCLGVPDKVSV